MKKSNKMLLAKAATAFFVVTGILILVLLGLLLGADNILVQREREESAFLRIKEYTYKETHTPEGIVEEFCFSVPENLERDSLLVFFAEHRTVQVYLEDQPVYRLQSSDAVSFINTTGENWVNIPLYREDAGHPVRVVLDPVYAGTSSQPEFLIGDGLAIFLDLIRREIPQLIIGGVLFLMGVGFLCMGGYSLLANRTGKELWALGVFALVLGLWKCANTSVSSLLLPDRTVFLACLSMIMVMIGMLPLVSALKAWYDKADTRLLDGYCIAASLVCSGQLVLQLLGVADLRQMYPVTWCVVVAGVLTMIGNAVYARVRYPAKYRRFSQKDLAWILGAGVLGDVVACLVKGSDAGLMFTIVSLLCYIVVAGVYNHALQLRVQREKERMLEEKDQQLIQSRIATMMSQIRSHFVFNILNAISGMCKYDPEKADKTVVRFARYLRANIDIMQDDQPVSFRSDLRHVEDYVSLEQVRFGDQIRFVTDITVDQFMIPPLILQPIVENAIKHGLTTKPSGGTITLRTEKDDSNIRIIVRDDGVGFDPSTAPSDKSVGLKNVQLRLQYMMRGSLDIASAPGQGTTVTITIPREEAEQCG